MRMIFVAAVVLLFEVSVGASQTVVAVCTRLESERQLLHQQFRDGKVCSESTVGRNWTDCTFRAGGTVVRLVGAIGMSPAQRAQGAWGSGFYVDAVDARHTVRFGMHDDLGLVTRIDARDQLQPSGCIYNEAHISLNSQVFGPGELNAIAYKMDGPVTEQDRVKATQQALIQLGYLRGAADGVLGPSTRAALDRYKTAKNLPADAVDAKVRQLVELDALTQSLDQLRHEFERVGPKPPDRRK